MKKLALSIFLLFLCLTLTTCAREQANDINKKISENIAQSGKDVRLTLDILGLWSLEKTEDVTGEIENLHDSLYLAFMSDGHVINVDGEEREEVTEENTQEILKMAIHYNSIGNYKNEYHIKEGKIFMYGLEELKKGCEEPTDILNIISLENNELIVSSEDEQVRFTFKRIFDWTALQ